ncbi:hypothetical protein BDN70DRAFT_572201 [Pholiota conissans]|uniref:Uncharacterized protein n=1 Tax=Pholiota conissans TaxID=109636 RepID=A0A9P6D2C2_9AGAR|nr:hypothetical protein BDN70DRAFT_572201 [Pholiota conissans]
MGCIFNNISSEIHDLILDHFNLPPALSSWNPDPQQIRASRDTLRAYSLVSRSCCIMARRRLFSSIILYVGLTPDFPNLNLTEIAAATEHFATMIQDSVKFPNIGMSYFIQSFTFTIPAACIKNRVMRFLRKPSIYRILDALHGPSHGITSLTLNMGVGRLDYVKLERELVRALEDITHSPKLKHLHINGLIDIPISLFHGVRLKTLELIRARVLREEGGHKCGVSIIETISLDNMLSFDGLIQHSNDASSNSLIFASPKALYIQGGSLPNAVKFAISTALYTLQSLSVHVDAPPTAEYPFHLLAGLSLLRILHGKDTSRNRKKELQQVLELCTLPPSLMSLTIETYDQDCLPYPTDWVDIDSVLVQTSFSCIPQVQIIFRLSCDANNHNRMKNLFEVRNLALSKAGEALPKFLKARKGASRPVLGVTISIYDDRERCKALTMKFGGKQTFEMPAAHQHIHWSLWC